MEFVHLEQALSQIFEDGSNTNTVLDWHKAEGFAYMDYLPSVLEELNFHHELKPEIKVALLTNIELLKTTPLREKGLHTLPKDWLHPQTLEPFSEKLEDLWLRPTEGYLVRILKESTDERDQAKLGKVLQSDAFKSRGLDKSREERLFARLEKLQKSIQENKIVLFLGRQNRIYKKLQQALNSKYEGLFCFISDHVWSACGYIERGVKASDNRLSLIQACETIRRLPELNLAGNRIQERFIMFSLDGYDAKVCLAAMYSDCNLIARNHPRPFIKGLDHFQFAYTGLTDLELANIVRNKAWFELTKFCRTGQNGEAEELSQPQVLQEYGIKYIGSRLISHEK